MTYLYRTLIFLSAFISVPSQAAEMQITGKVIETQGHITMACRMLKVKQDVTNTVFWFRFPNTGNDNSMLAVAMTAQSGGLKVLVDYDTAVTSGCGTEPAVAWIAMQSQ